MTIKGFVLYFVVFICCISCTNKEKLPEFIIPEESCLEKILEKGTLDISTFYNTTDYYVYRGITRGFHYDLALDFAHYLGVRLQIVEVNNDIDTAINRLQEGKYDLLAISMTQTPERNKQLSFSQPLFHTGEVLVQHKGSTSIKNISELDGKEIFIPKSATSYRKVLEEIEDSLDIHIYITEVDRYSNEDLLHLVETGEINYTVIDENIVEACQSSLKNIDYSLKLRDNISISWTTNSGTTALITEINTWLEQVRQSGKLGYLYKRYFNNLKSVPHHTTKYAVLKKGDISPFDQLLKKESKRINWDWRLLAALVYSESHFNPEAESAIGAYGLMQVIPETAEHFNVSDYFQPDSNVYVGIQYLAYLEKYFKQYSIDSTERVKFVLASYNAGLGHVLDAMRLTEKYGKDLNKWDGHVDFYLQHKNEPQYYRDPLSRNGYCNGPQTYKYVLQVLETYNNYKNINK